MVMDASALVAILLSEPGHEELLEKVSGVQAVAIPAPTLVEALIVVSGRGVREAAASAQAWMDSAGVETVPFTAVDAEIAHRAFLEFGKGRHPARLNFGDCMSYAVARRMRLPLLFVGADFSLTDVVPA